MRIRQVIGETGGEKLKEGDRKREPTRQERERANYYARKWIIPLLGLEPGERTARVREIAEAEWEIPHSRRCTVAESTVWRLLNQYQEQSLDGLLRKPRKDIGEARRLPKYILDRAIEIRQDLKSRSVRRILKILKREYPLEIENVKSSTLSHALTAAGHPRVRPQRTDKNGPRKERHIRMRWEHPLQLVQSDECGHALWVRESGNIQKAKLLGVLDHCSKLSLYSEWFLSANLPALEKCVTQSLLTYGVCERLHVDNGAIYRSYLLENVCSAFGIDLKFTRRGYAPGKGGIERFWLTVEEDFCQEIGDSTRFTLAELNRKYHAWEWEYNRTVHSATGETPLELYQRLAGEPCWPDPIKLRRAAMLREHRTVDKRYCTVSVRCKEFAVDPILRGKRVEIRYDAFALDEVLIYDLSGSHLLQRALPQPVDASPAPFLPAVPAHPTPTIDALTPLQQEMMHERAAATVPARRPREPKKPTFVAFCQQVGQLLMRESDLSSFELGLLRENWDRYGPFVPEFVVHTLEPLVGHAGHQLHIGEYLQALIAAHLSHLSQSKE